MFRFFELLGRIEEAAYNLSHVRQESDDIDTPLRIKEISKVAMRLGLMVLDTNEEAAGFAFLKVRADGDDVDMLLCVGICAERLREVAICIGLKMLDTDEKELGSIIEKHYKRIAARSLHGLRNGSGNLMDKLLVLSASSDGDFTLKEIGTSDAELESFEV